MAFTDPTHKGILRTSLFGALLLVGALFSFHLAHADFGIPSSTLVLYHFQNNTSDTQNNADLTVGTSGGNYVDMLANLGKAKDVVAPSSFNSANTINLNGKTEATVGAWILPGSDQNQTVPFGTEAGDLFQQISGWKIRCDLPDFNDYNGSTVMSTSSPTFVACVYKNSHTDLYINGVKDGGGVTSTASISESASKVDVGNWTGQAKWTGHVDDAFIVPVALSSSSLVSIYNYGDGLPLCTTDGCGSAATYTPNLSSPGQFKADASSTLSSGATTAEHSIVFKGTLTSTSSNLLFLQVEVQPSTTLFTNVATLTSAGVSSGTIASTTLGTDTYVDGNYHWQYRARDGAASTTSAWTSFGATATSTDFVVGGRPTGVEISDGTVKVLYHFDNNASDTIGNADLNVGTSGGGYVDMLSNLSKAKDVEAPGSFNSANTINLNGKTEATIGGWILPANSNQNQAVPIGTESGNLFQQISGYKIRCDLPTFNDYNGSTVMSTSTPTFVACVYKNSHEDLYINGVKDGSGASVPSSVSESASKVDAGNWTGSAKWSGDLDEAFIISKALSTSTILSLYNGGLGMPICVTAGCNRDPASYYAQIQGTGTLNLRQNPNTSSTILKTLPADWVMYVSSTVSATGTTVISNGYKWFDVVDKTDGVEGWMAATSSSATYLSYVSSSQSDFQTKASTLLTTSSTRAEKLVSAVDWYWSHVSSTDSLYNTGFSYLFSATSSASSTWIFPKELFYAMASQESGSSSNAFNDDIISSDYGHGIMQLTPYQVWAHEPTSTGNWINNTEDVPTPGSHIVITPCAMIATTTYINCYTHGGEHDSTPKSYKDYGYSNASTTYKFYANTYQSIYANMKDGLAKLRTKYAAASSTATASSTTFQPYEREWIHATWGYNGFTTSTTYLTKVATQMDTFHDYYSSTGTKMVATSSFSVDLANKLRIADNNKEQVIVYSAVTVSISDSAGRQAGIVNGVIKEDIPDSAYNPQTESAVVFFPEGKEPFTYTVVGKGTGTYGLQIIHARNGIKNIMYAPAIPTKPGEIDQYSVDWNAVAQNSKGVIVKIDNEGDGVIDKTLITGADLADISLYTAPPPKDEGRPVVVAPPPPPPPIQLSLPLLLASPAPPPAPSSTEEINPPVISNLTNVVASTSITISWTTNKPATSELLFGSSTVMAANIAPDPAFVTSHSQLVSRLVSGTTYYYEVQSKDASGNTGSSAQQSFTTPGQ